MSIPNKKNKKKKFAISVKLIQKILVNSLIYIKSCNDNIKLLKNKELELTKIKLILLMKKISII